MKCKTLIVVFMLCCTACVQTTKQPVNAFLGSWMNCETMSGGNIITANVCGRFTFVDNNTGVFAIGTRQMIFTYNANNTNHTIKFSGIFTGDWFGKNRVFIYAFNNSAGDTTLVLSEADSVQYILEKETAH